MRPIKFRVWDVEAKKMLHWESVWYSLVKIPNGAVVGQECDEWLPFISAAFMAPDSKLVPEQFTGLKDKTGRDIYEGDILRIAEWNGTEVVFTQTGKVYWDPYACRFSIATDGGRGRISELNTSTGGLLSEQSRDEVVGNVHENPDLLS